MYITHEEQKRMLLEKATTLDNKANSISHSFNEVKKNPLDLNNIMKHVMLLSSMMHDRYTDDAKELRQQADSIGKEVMD